jgi:hypothetical protein
MRTKATVLISTWNCFNFVNLKPIYVIAYWYLFPFFAVIPCIGRYCATLNNYGFTDKLDFTLLGTKTTLSHNGGDTITLHGHGFGNDGYYTRDYMQSEYTTLNRGL